MRAQDHEPASTSQSPARRPDTPVAASAPVHPEAPLTAAAILDLQRGVGNAAVAGLVGVQRLRAHSHADDRPVQRSAPAAHTGHSVRPGAAVQRVVHGSEAEKQAQREQLENLAAMWLPVEKFDADGNAGPVPEFAYAGQRAGYEMDAVRVERAFTPPSRTTTRTGVQLTQNQKIEFQTYYFVYTVQAINDPGRRRSDTLIDLNAPFRVVKRVPKKSWGRSMGRTYRFGDYWDVNPEFRLDLPGDHAEAMRALVEGRGLKADKRVRGDDLDSLEQLPSDPHQPFLFYTPKITDPNFTHRNGARKHNRRFLLPAAYDRLAGQSRTRGQVGLSKPPLANRQHAGRVPAAEMGGFRAHDVMPTTGRGGTGDRLASHEWCHLIGDNDDGPTVFHNLVVGTNAVNTEQLAMESALRDFRPRMDGLGYAIRLRVEAIVEQAEAANPAIPGGPYHKADWISFTIDIVDKAASAGPVATRPSVAFVHRQIMDADRGTITESEFTSLHNQVRNLLRAEHSRLKAERQGSPMALD
ncbi:hypothetical protein [Kutzneria sp. CA-103260]|uniref:hypothetical protein n=1 Tax=Kutzneria sp. CA-103260 TaxID=2802641 RepID=UPI001BA69CFC|nr:hypothetical protein [Kutzneria sp. CA-103260]QUQ63953.1 hypothetical protein JJ691_16700 [Kutzneria sp. CA-103260]